MESLTKVMWTVDNFSLLKRGELIDSPYFTVGKKYPSTCTLILSLRKNFIRLELDFAIRNKMYKVMKYGILRIYSEDGTKLEVRTESFWGRLEVHIFDIDVLEDLDTVTVECQIRQLTQPSPDEAVFSSGPKWTCDLLSSLWRMRCNAVATDVELKVGEDQTVPCHQIVLASRSSVLKTMLTNPAFVESRSDSISTKFGLECVKKLVEFMYLDLDAMTGVEEDLDLVCELCFAAQYYAVQGLKNWCEDVLITNVTTDNLLTTLELASNASCQKVIQKCVEFVGSNADDINFKEFEHLFAKDPALAAQLFKAAACQTKVAQIEESVAEVVPYWDFFQKKELVDLTLECKDGSNILCHKAILMVYFSDIKSILSLVKSTNIESVMALLYFIYTGNIMQSDTRHYYKYVELLFVIACDNKMFDLKSKCEEILLDVINFYNALFILKFAWEYPSVVLGYKALEFIKANPRLLESDLYGSLREDLKSFLNEKIAERVPDCNSLKTVLVYEKELI